MVANPRQGRQTPETRLGSGTVQAREASPMRPDPPCFSDLQTIALLLERAYIEFTRTSVREGGVNLRR